MRILFICPRSNKPLLNEYNPDRIFFKILSKFIAFRKPTAFAILAALTPKKHVLDYIEATPDEINYNENYDLICLTSLTESAFSTYEIADGFYMSGNKVVIGGYHASALPEEAKQHADSVVIGEAEETWPQLLNDVENDRLKPYYYPKRPVPPGIIPFQDTSIYQKALGHAVQATRGCPYRCDFCCISNMKFRQVYRKRPIQNVIDEIGLNLGKLFVFQDNSLTIDPNYTIDLFKSIKGLNKNFLAYGNINVLGKNDELLKAASEAGCIGWLIGLESVCQESLDEIGKKTNKVDQYISQIKKIHDYGMIIEAPFIFCFDHDTIDIFEKTDEFVRKSEIDVPIAMKLVPYPGTPIYERFEGEKRIITKDWSKYNGINVVFQPKNMTPEELSLNFNELSKKWLSLSFGFQKIIKSLKFGKYTFFEITSMQVGQILEKILGRY